ncbi:hypothetical protein MMC29_000198 [Sticta canariensis]|nr:hypothetical protein [Sticta canariensis]
MLDSRHYLPPELEAVPPKLLEVPAQSLARHRAVLKAAQVSSQPSKQPFDSRLYLIYEAATGPAASVRLLKQTRLGSPQHDIAARQRRLDCSLSQAFVRDRILAFVGEPAFAKRLYMTPDVMKQAATEAFAELSRPAGGAYGLESASQYRLVFRHDCLSLGCLDPDCGLCRQTLHRRCVGTFGPKYLSGDQLKAKCGAPIRVEVFDHATGLPVQGDQLSDLHLEVGLAWAFLACPSWPGELHVGVIQAHAKTAKLCIACVLEGKAYSELEPGMESEEDLDMCMLLTNSQGRELLAPGKGAEQADNKKIILKLQDGQVSLQAFPSAWPFSPYCNAPYDSVTSIDHAGWPGAAVASLSIARLCWAAHARPGLLAGVSHVLLAGCIFGHAGIYTCMTFAELSMSVLGSSIALLSGQKPPFRWDADSLPNPWTGNHCSMLIVCLLQPPMAVAPAPWCPMPAMTARCMRFFPRPINSDHLTLYSYSRSSNHISLQREMSGSSHSALRPDRAIRPWWSPLLAASAFCFGTTSMLPGFAEGNDYYTLLKHTSTHDTLTHRSCAVGRLLVRAIRSSSGQRARHIAHAVSDAFVVATQRVKQAQKSSIPHMEEHVSKLDFVGVQTQLKLQDIKGAAAASGVVGLSVIHNNITTVRQFKELVESSERDVQLQETLRKVLNFTAKGWEAARQHALRAVGTDNRMRIWCADDNMDAGLLFRCSLGRVDLHAPVGLLKKKSLEGGHITMEAVFTQQQGTYERGLVSQLQAAAADDWWRPGHPGWAIWPADSEHFLRQVLAHSRQIDCNSMRSMASPWLQAFVPGVNRPAIITVEAPTADVEEMHV